MFSKTKERGDIYICQNFYSAKLKLRNLSNKEKNKPKKVVRKFLLHLSGQHPCSLVTPFFYIRSLPAECRSI